MDFTSCLNLTNHQFVVSTNPNAPHEQKPRVPFKPQYGPHPAIRPGIGQQAASGFRPGPQKCVFYLSHTPTHPR